MSKSDLSVAGEKNVKLELIYNFCYSHLDCKKNILNFVKFLIKWTKTQRKILRFIPQIKNN